MKSVKICIAASAGGHLNQLLQLESVWQGHDVVCLSTSEMVRTRLELIGRTHITRECNRNNLVRLTRVFFKCLKIAAKERPDVVISTGAAVGCIACYLCKMLGAKVIWLDSIANVRDLSMSGRMVRRIADLFLVQWPELAARYKNAEYVGTVI